MYKIEQKDYGIKLTFSGLIRAGEMKSWQVEMIKLLKRLPETFGMLIDMREMQALPQESQGIMVSTQKIFKPRVERSATIVSKVITNIQFKRIGNQSKVNETKIFINALDEPNWEEVAKLWIVHAVAPKTNEEY